MQRTEQPFRYGRTTRPTVKSILSFSTQPTCAFKGMLLMEEVVVQKKPIKDKLKKLLIVDLILIPPGKAEKPLSFVAPEFGLAQ